MRLYKFTFQHHPSQETLSVFYLAGDDYEFLRDCLGWAHDVTCPEEPGKDATPQERRQWHEDTALYHQSYADALSEHGFKMEPEGHGSWESQEVTEEDIVQLRRLGVIE